MADWARAAGELDAASALFSQPWAASTVAGSMAMSAAADARIEALRAAATRVIDSSVPPSTGLVPRLAGSLQLVGQQLQALQSEAAAAPIAAINDSPAAASYISQIDAAAQLVHLCARLALPGQLPAAEALRFSRRCAQLLLGPGRRTLAGLAVLAEHDSDARHACHRHLTNQLKGFVSLVDLCASPRIAALDAFIADGLPPAPLAAWLAGAVSVLLLLQRMRAPAAWVSAMIMLLAGLLGSTSSRTTTFRPHVAALQQQGRVLPDLLGLLLPALSAVAVALQLPPGRRSGHSWNAAGILVITLCCAALRPTLEARLAAGGSAASSALRAAAALALHAPLAAPEELQERQALVMCTQLASLLRLASGSVQQSDGERQRAVEQLRAALPGLRGALQLTAAAARQDPSGDANSLRTVAELCQQWFALLRQMAAWCDQTLLGQAAHATAGSPARLAAAWDAAGGSPGLAAWLEAAATALQALPSLADLARQPAATQLPRGDVQCWAGAAFGLIEFATAAASSVASLLLFSTCGGGPLCATLWRLHTTACRAIHWLAAGGMPPQLPWPTHATSQEAGDCLLTVMEIALSAFALPPEGGQPTADGGEPMRAMCAAQFAALQVLAARGMQLSRVRSDAAIEALIGCTAAPGLDGLPLQPGFSDSLAWAMRSLAAMPDEPRMLAASRAAARTASGSPRFVAALAAEGALEQLAALLAIPPVGPGPHPPEAQAQAMAAFEDVLAGIRGLVGAAAGLEAAHGPAAAVQAALDEHVAQPGLAGGAALTALLQHVLPPTRQLAAALLEHWRRPEQAAEDTLALAQAAAARSCAYLRCANLAGEGGPAAGQGAGSSKCSACRAVWYCGTTCSHADWRGPGGHRRMCRALGAARQAARQQQRQAVGPAAAAQAAAAEAQAAAEGSPPGAAE